MPNTCSLCRSKKYGGETILFGIPTKRKWYKCPSTGLKMSPEAVLSWTMHLLALCFPDESPERLEERLKGEGQNKKGPGAAVKYFIHTSHFPDGTVFLGPEYSMNRITANTLPLKPSKNPRSTPNRMSFLEASKTVKSRRTKSTLRGLAMEDERRKRIAEENRASRSERELTKKVKVTPPKSLFSGGKLVLDPAEEAIYMEQLERLLSPIHTKEEVRQIIDRMKGMPGFRMDPNRDYVSLTGVPQNIFEVILTIMKEAYGDRLQYLPSTDGALYSELCKNIKNPSFDFEQQDPTKRFCICGSAVEPGKVVQDRPSHWMPHNSCKEGKGFTCCGMKLDHCPCLPTLEKNEDGSPILQYENWVESVKCVACQESFHGFCVSRKPSDEKEFRCFRCVGERPGRQKKLDARNQIFLALIILRTALSYRQASSMFYIGKTTVADTFSSVMLGLDEIFARMFPPLTRESDPNIINQVPARVAEHGMPNASTVIDASPFKLNKPRGCLITQRATYNAYRNGNKFKSSKYIFSFSHSFFSYLCYPCHPFHPTFTTPCH